MTYFSPLWTTIAEYCIKEALCWNEYETNSIYFIVEFSHRIYSLYLTMEKKLQFNISIAESWNLLLFDCVVRVYEILNLSDRYYIMLDNLDYPLMYVE